MKDKSGILKLCLVLAFDLYATFDGSVEKIHADPWTDDEKTHSMTPCAMTFIHFQTG